MANHASAFLAALLALPLCAQLIAPGQAVPRTAHLPVVFLNGYQNDCGGSSFASTFGIADQVAQANGQVSVFFDNCTTSGKPSIEKLGTALGNFLSSLKYTDGGAVDTVDVVAHSMGGLILRSYLSGKQDTTGIFSPPAVTHVRKVVFLGTPHFGTGVAALGLGLNAQLDELSSGSHFLYDLAVWNDATDDLRGVDAVAVIGNGGTGQATMAGFDDGVVALTSASLGFYLPGRTRVVPFCHVDGGGLITLGGFCASNAQGIAKMRAATDAPARIMTSFLNGTPDWQTIGETAEQNKFLSTVAGLYVRPFTSTGQPQKLTSATTTPQGGNSKKLNMSNDEIAYTDLLSAGQTAITATASSGTLMRTMTVHAGSELAIPLKPGPNIARVLPAAASVFPLSVAPRMIVSIYGDSLAQAVDQASALPLPTTLSDARVMFNGVALGLFYASPGQINALLPDRASGFLTLTVQNASGSSSVNLIVEAAHPAIFTLDGTGTGAAAAINARNGMVVGSTNPLHPQDFLELFLTGLGVTQRQNGLDIAVTVPQVTIGGLDCPVSFAGAAPGYVGLDQINCRLPAAIKPDPAASITVSSRGRTSNIANLAIQ